MTRRYQRGCLRAVPRKSGPAMWEFSYWETGPDGKPHQKHPVLGSTKELSRKAAEDQADKIRLRLNAEQQQPALLKFGWVAGDYIKHELDSERSRLAYATREGNRSYLRRWILDRWQNEHLDRIRGAEVEEWLDSLDDLADGSKAKIRNVMSGIYSHAKRQGWTQFNPISTVRQSAARERVPDVLTPDEVRRICKALGLRELVLALLGAGNGPRVSESLALKWEDVDWKNMQFSIQRSIYHQRINDNCKTGKSKKSVPLHEVQIPALYEWRLVTPYNREEDWIFASPQMQGKQPFWPEQLRKKLQAAVRRVGINKKVGWHTFRHTFSTMLRANKEDISIQTDLLRNSVNVALKHYTQAIPEATRAAQARVLDMIFGEKPGNVTFEYMGVSPTVN